MFFEYKLFRGGLETAQAFLAEHGAAGWRCHTCDPCPPTFEVLVLVERAMETPFPANTDAGISGLAMKS